MDLSLLTLSELLSLHGQINEDLRRRKIARTANNPTGDLAEYLFCKAFDWKQEDNSAKGFDAMSRNGIRYQIKGRRLHNRNISRQLSALRGLHDGPFDYLAGLLFTSNYTVLRAAIIPIEIVKKRAALVQRTNSYRFILHDDVWNEAGVVDVTQDLTLVLEREA